MASLNWFQRLSIRYFSKPLSDRRVLVHLLTNPVKSILEIGVGNGNRTRRLIALARSVSADAPLRYTGVDPFESANDGRAHLRLKDAHRMMAELKVKAHLIPGDALSALPRVAHSVPPSDLVIVDGGWNETSPVGIALSQWLPRLAAEHATVFACTKPQYGLVSVVLERPLAIRRVA